MWFELRTRHRIENGRGISCTPCYEKIARMISVCAAQRAQGLIREQVELGKIMGKSERQPVIICTKLRTLERESCCGLVSDHGDTTRSMSAAGALPP